MQEDLRNIGRLGYSWRERIKSHVRSLRQNQTESEEIVWKLLRNRKFGGKKFLRQHPIIYSYYKRPLYFVADFYCAEHKLIIEIDGGVHEFQKEYDEQRDFVMKQKGLKVLRIKNEELNNLEKVMEKILQAME
jgi:leucyl-tRNA synthetase